MIDELYFLDDCNVKITAASVGISQRRWVSTNEKEVAKDEHLQKMIKNRFDLLPIDEQNEKITSYYKTEKPNDFSQVNKHTITYQDTLNLETDIRTVIDKFNLENRTFYFLTFQKQVKGLITIGNLNCCQVQIYIFSLMCDL